MAEIPFMIFTSENFAEKSELIKKTNTKSN